MTLNRAGIDPARLDQHITDPDCPGNPQREPRCKECGSTDLYIHHLKVYCNKCGALAGAI